MNIHELDSYDLGDAVKFNDKLNPRIWGADEKMRPEIREQLLRIADDFREFLGIDVEVKDITVSGSNAAYTYTPHSDIDLHLVVDLPEADRNEVYRELFDAKKYAYNEQHDITIGGYDVELYVQDANKPHHSQGIYSLINDNWVAVPKRRRPDVDDISVKSKFEDLGQRIETAIKSQDYEKISAMADKLKDYRQAGLDSHGEFGPENLAFKILRTQGLIKKLYDARGAAKDELLSLDERRKKKKKKSVRYGYGGYWYPGTAYAGQDHPAGTEGGDGGGDGGGESVREDAGMTWDGVNPTTDMFTSEDATMTWDGVNPSTAMFTTETQDTSDEDILRDFVDFCVKELKIEQMPRVKLRRDPQWPAMHRTFGRYNDETKTLEVAWGQRHIMDVLRTVAHELTHKHQHEREGDKMGADAGETGSPYENEANARAGVLMRDYGRLHPEYFTVGQAHDLEESASGYIPTKAQAKDPRYSMALTVDIKPGQMGKEANKLKLKTNKQGQPQIAQANGLFENLFKEYKQYKADEDYSPDEPPGPEFKPTMPAGTVRVDVSDVYDWYKLGQHISNMKGLGRHDFGAGPPSSIISFGDEDTEHEFIKDLKATGLDVTDIDPKDPKKRPGGKIKTDPTYNVDEAIHTPVSKDRDAEQYYRFILGKAKLGRPLTRAEQDYVKMYQVYRQQKLAEFAPGPGRDDNDDVPDQLVVLANRWWNATDKQPQIEHVLNSLGWSIRQVESEDDAVQLQHRDGTTYFISADDFDPDLFESQEQLDEVAMSPGALQKWAKSPEAQGIRAGFEAELIFRDTTNDDDDDGEMEPDYDYDERARSVQGVIDFFQGGDYGGMSQREENRLQEGLDNQYLEWMDERMYDAFRDEQEDLIKKVLVDEDWDEDNEIQKQLALLDLTDDEINAIINAGERAPRFTKSSEQQAYIQENPLYKQYLDAQTEAEGLLDELVQDSIRAQDKFYDAALDDFRENFYVDDDSSFFQDVGLSYMSDIAAEYSLDWPYMTGGGGGNNGGSRDWEDIGTSLQAAIDMPVKVSSNYHSTTRKEGRWIVEPDSSLDPDDREDFGLEIVSPPLPLLDALEKLQEVTDWANNPSEGNAYTNQSTGLHMGVSVPYKGGDVDYLKLILFLGDEYVLQSFGREANTYTKSAMQKFRENIRSGRADPAGALMLMKNNLIEFAQREIQKGVGTSKYTSAHIQDGYIEFRSAGGDWLAEESADPQKLSSTMLRYARAMQIAANPSEERREYAKKLYKLVAPEGDSQLALFSQFAAGAIDKDELKKQWAEKTIGTERKMNQRWKLYNRATGEPVPGQEYNGYTEEEARARAKGKISPGSSDRDFDAAYELRNIGQEQQWEIYSVDTGKTLEIVKGRNKGEAADAVFDKYAAQKIGFNVRPYQDPATMSPRAKLAKRITSQPGKPLDYNYEIVNQADVRLPVVDKFYATNDTDAQKVYSQWLKNKDLPDDTADYGYRKVAAKPVQATGVQDVEPDVAQNFDNARDSATLQTNLQGRAGQDATEVPRNWEFVNRINGQVIHNMTNASYNQANVVQANLETRYPDADIYLRSVSNLEENFVNESIDPISGAGAVPPRQDPKGIGKKTVTPAEKVFKNPVQGQPYRSAIGQAISKKDLEDMTQQIQVARRLGDSIMEMEDTPPEVLQALDQAAQKNGYKNWADVKANPHSPQAVMTVAKLANTILRTTGPHHEKLFYKNKTDVDENFADGKVKGKSRPGRVKRAGASCAGSVTDLRARAKNASGEKAKMYHWCANMKSGRKK
jgi:hypothetical protein